MRSSRSAGRDRKTFIPVLAAGAPTPPPILEQRRDHRTHINIVATRAGTSNEGGFRVSSDQLHALGDRLGVADRGPRTLRENCAVTEGGPIARVNHESRPSRRVAEGGPIARVNHESR